MTDSLGEFGMLLDPGDYVVVEVLQDGWHQSSPGTPVLDPGLDTGDLRLGCHGHAYTVFEDPVATDLDFGNFIPTKAGAKFNDLNGDGQRDAEEPGLAGWEIRAYADDGDGVLQQGEYDAGPTAVDVTDCRGEYGLLLEPGDYVVVELSQDGWHQSMPGATVLDLDLDTGTEQLGCFGYQNTVETGQVETDVDFGNFVPTNAGTKFNDTDGDGLWDENEPALSGWEAQPSPPMSS